MSEREKRTVPLKINDKFQYEGVRTLMNVPFMSRSVHGSSGRTLGYVHRVLERRRWFDCPTRDESPPFQ